MQEQKTTTQPGSGDARRDERGGAYDLQAIYAEVKDLILDSLDKSDENCTLSSRLIHDLEAESLDFLDIAFRIERSFQVKIERGRLEKELRARLPNLNIKPNTQMTDDVKDVLKSLMPEVPAASIDALKKVKDTASVFSIATFVRVAVQAIQESKPGASIIGRTLEGFSPEQLGVQSNV